MDCRRTWSAVWMMIDTRNALSSAWHASMRGLFLDKSCLLIARDGLFINAYV